MTIRKTARSCLTKSLFAPRRLEDPFPAAGTAAGVLVNNPRWDAYSSCGTGSIRTCEALA